MATKNTKEARIIELSKMTKELVANNKACIARASAVLAGVGVEFTVRGGYVLFDQNEMSKLRFGTNSLSAMEELIKGKLTDYISVKCEEYGAPWTMSHASSFQQPSQPPQPRCSHRKSLTLLITDIGDSQWYNKDEPAQSPFSER